MELSDEYVLKYRGDQCYSIENKMVRYIQLLPLPIYVFGIDCHPLFFSVYYLWPTGIAPGEQR